MSVEIIQIPAKLIEGLRGWYHPKDRSVILDDDCFIEGSNISSPGSPILERNRIYYQENSPGNGWYSQDNNAREWQFSGDISAWQRLISTYQILPGLVGFWPMSSIQRSTGNAYDLSGQSRTLTYNGNPTYNIYNYLTPYIDLDGTGDYLSRLDEADLDILGTETIYDSTIRGLTFGGWFRTSDVTPPAISILTGKFLGGGQFGYEIQLRTDSTLRFHISNTGADIYTVDSSISPNDNEWFSVIGRFTPSSELAIFFNDTKTTNVVGIPASIFNSNASFCIGARSGGTSLLTGNATLCFLCANILSDNLVLNLVQQTRYLFGI